MKKLLLCMCLVLGVCTVATPLVAADTGSAVVSTDSGSAAPIATPAPAASSGSAVTQPDAASKIHDPLQDPKATLSDVEQAKHLGWAALAFVVLLIVCRLIGRAKSLPIVGSKLAFLGVGKAATVIAALGALGAAGYDAIAGGGTALAALFAGGMALLHYIDATPKASQLSPEGKDAVRKLAERVYRDPRRASVSDAEMLARAVLMLTAGKLPPRKR